MTTTLRNYVIGSISECVDIDVTIYDTNVKVHAAVSGALDRLHYEKDPCVKYDSSKKVWVYLHRNRTRDEFGMDYGVLTFIYHVAAAY